MTERTLEDLKAENERLKLSLENAKLEKMGLEVELESATLIANTVVAQAKASEALQVQQQQQLQGVLQSQDQQHLQIDMGPESQRQVIPEQPKAPGGAPVPRGPLGGAPSGPPKKGDKVRVTCRSGATIRATGMRCDGKIQELNGVISDSGGLTGGGGRRVIYVCQTCSQPWHVTY